MSTVKTHYTEFVITWQFLLVIYVRCQPNSPYIESLCEHTKLSFRKVAYAEVWRSAKVIKRGKCSLSRTLSKSVWWQGQTDAMTHTRMWNPQQLKCLFSLNGMCVLSDVSPCTKCINMYNCWTWGLVTSLVDICWLVCIIYSYNRFCVRLSSCV
jgi:hypothetical protein